MFHHYEYSYLYGSKYQSTLISFLSENLLQEKIIIDLRNGLSPRFKGQQVKSQTLEDSLKSVASLHQITPQKYNKNIISESFITKQS